MFVLVLVLLCIVPQALKHCQACAWCNIKVHLLLALDETPIVLHKSDAASTAVSPLILNVFHQWSPKLHVQADGPDAVEQQKDGSDGIDESTQDEAQQAEQVVQDKLAVRFVTSSK